MENFYSRAAMMKELGLSRDGLDSRLNYLKITGASLINGKRYSSPHFSEAELQQVRELELKIKEEKKNGYRVDNVIKLLNTNRTVFNAIIQKFGFTPCQQVVFCQPSFTREQFEIMKQYVEQKKHDGDRYRTQNQIAIKANVTREAVDGVIKTLGIKSSLKDCKKQRYYLLKDESRIIEYLETHAAALAGLVNLTVAADRLRVTVKTLKKMAANAGFTLKTNPLKKEYLFISKEEYDQLKAKQEKIHAKEILTAKMYEGQVNYVCPDYSAAQNDLKSGKIPPSPLAIRKKYPSLSLYQTGILLREHARKNAQKNKTQGE